MDGRAESDAGHPPRQLLRLEHVADHLLFELVEVERRAHQASSHYDDEPWRAENFTRALPGKRELSLVAVVRDRPVGFLIASRQQHVTHIHRLATDPGQWRTGTASQLLDRFLAEVSGTVTVVCDPRNKPALTLYERAGFRVTGSTPAGKAALAAAGRAVPPRTSAER
ncbi:GNAT family N-acetyltransferase [Streptomyces sp. 8K308]|uniref:GNAT family N-acetyltransferase n=1 Tax=Streptomyces sp. 8K308 TaxID=2530388 RepID=UPI00140524CD|nr:GNAT family N-acetyltransferase [Streptomyces sp. 8K308]